MMLLLLALGGRPADACSCDSPVCAEILAPEEPIAADHAVVIVPSPSVSCEPADAADGAALLREGAEVAIEIDEEGGAYWITPEGGWEAGAEYTVSLPREGGDPATASFTVGEALDEDPPPAPTIVGAERSAVEDDGKNCGDADFIGFELRSEADEPVFYEVAYAREGLDLAAAPSMLFPEAGWAFVGEAGCDANTGLFSGPYQLRARAIDAAGNASEWSEVVAVGGGCEGCAAGGPAGSLLGALLGLAAVRAGGRAPRRRPRPGAPGSPSLPPGTRTPDPDA